MLKKFWFWWTISAVLLVGSVALYIRFRNGSQEQDPEQNPEQDPEVDPDPGLSNLNDNVRDQRLLGAYKTVADTIEQQTGQRNNVLALMLTAQAAHETGDFTSVVYMSNHNLFGMRQPKVRETTSMAELNGYASYINDAESVKDRLLWLKYSDEPITASVNDFVDFLKSKSYFEASKTEYRKGVDYWARLLNSLLAGG